MWATKSARHGEIAEHEAALRATLRDPDAVYFDPASTAEKRPVGGAAVESLHYASWHRTVGAYAGRLLIVVIKCRRSPDGATEAFVQTMYVATGVKGRMQLRWKRSS